MLRLSQAFVVRICEKDPFRTAWLLLIISEQHGMHGNTDYTSPLPTVLSTSFRKTYFFFFFFFLLFILNGKSICD